MAKKTTGKQLESGFAELQEKFAAIQLEKNATKRVMRKVGQPLLSAIKRRVPKGGYPGDKPEFKPLRDTMMIKPLDYGDHWMIIVGARYPEGAHSHLVEGEYTPRTSPPMTLTEFIEPAMNEQEMAILRQIDEHVGKQVIVSFDRG